MYETLAAKDLSHHQLRHVGEDAAFNEANVNDEDEDDLIEFVMNDEEVADSEEESDEEEDE